MATPPADTRAVRTISRRPIGVTILSLLSLVAALFATVAGIAILTAGTFLASMASDAFVAGMAGAVGIVVSVLFFVYALFAFTIAWGLLRQHKWAWYAASILVVVQLLQGLGTLFSGALVTGLGALALAGFVGWYLLSPPVQAWFGVSYHTPWTYRRGGRPA